MNKNNVTTSKATIAVVRNLRKNTEYRTLKKPTKKDQCGGYFSYPRP